MMISWVHVIMGILKAIFSRDKTPGISISLPISNPYNYLVDKKWLDNNVTGNILRQTPTAIIIHHSAESDNSLKNDWTAIDKYHRSFRINWNPVASPIDKNWQVSGVVYYHWKDCDYINEEVRNFYSRAHKPVGSQVGGLIGKDYFESAWRKIAYNLGIEYDSTNAVNASGKPVSAPNSAPVIRYGRGLNEDGAHTFQEGMNSKSVGLCILGSYDSKKPDPVVWRLAVRVCKDLVYKFGIKDIRGHREVDGVKKTCPGSMFSMDEFRKDVFS